MEKDSMEMFQKILDWLDRIGGRFDKMDGRFDEMDERLDKMDERFEIVELKQDRTARKLEDLRLDIAIAERDIRRDIHLLKDETETVIEILKMHELLPG